jgi:predicted extracellular nuclease
MTQFLAPIHSPGRLTVLAALLAGLSSPAMAAPADVVISQVYGGGGNTGSVYKNDFIELFNRSASAVSLNGWSVQYASATGTTWASTPLPAVVLQPGQYLLVQEAAGTGGTTALPTADKIGTLAMSGTAGKVALVSSLTALSGAAPSGATLVDLVGFGSTAGAFEGAGATPAPSNSNAVLRAGGGCTDTDNNNTDFVAGLAAPRNSASPLNSCGAAVVFPIVATCPANLTVQLGNAGFAALSATDQDGIVNSAVITSPPVAGITLGALTAAGAAGGTASVNLNVSAAALAGSYPLTVSFGNDQGQNTSCSVSVSVQGLAAVTKTIPQIQGSGATSAFAGTVQTTEGVVTAKVGSGYFIQDPVGDGDPTTSDGLFVFAANGAVAVGDLVRVTGTVSEYTPTGATRSVTELITVTATLVRSSGNTITPTNIALDANLARVEGMLVHFNDALTVNQSEFLATRGELTLSNSRHETPTNRHRPGTPEAQAMAAANAADMIVLDDGIFVTPTVIPYINAGYSVRAGDTVTGLTGVIDFGAKGGGGAAFKLQPTLPALFSASNPRTLPPPVAAGNVKVASANVLNFFTTFTNGFDVTGASGKGCQLGASNTKSNCRGADNLAEFTRQRDKIVNELKALDADVVGLMEIQNNGEYAVDYLVNALNASIGAATYAYVPKPAATGTDAIRVAMIYKPAKLNLVGGALSDADAINNRPPMAQSFKIGNGAKFSVIVNHMKSKGSCGTGANGDQGDGQGCWNALRVQQANRLTGVFVPQVIAAAGDPDVLLIGDLNSHGFEDPIIALNDAGFANQLERFVRPTDTPYSYVFNGEAGYLDHALANPSLAPQVVGAAEWHNNADESPAIDYNTDAKPNDLYVNDAYRASDHDPVIISLDLAPTYVNVSAGFTVARSGLTVNRATGIYSGTFAFTNKSGAAINGPFQVELSGLPTGVTLTNATGSHNGLPYITVNSASIAAGATVNLTTTFSNPNKVAINYAATIYSGSF